MKKKGRTTPPPPKKGSYLTVYICHQLLQRHQRKIQSLTLAAYVQVQGTDIPENPVIGREILE